MHQTMKINLIQAGILEAPLKVPFVTAVRRVEKMTDVVVRIEGDDGQVGWGSAPPTGKVTGDTVGSILAALSDHIRPTLLGRDTDDLEGCLDSLDGCIVGNTSAKAAVDIALHDLWARSLKQPLWRLLGGSGTSIETDVTVSVGPVPQMIEDAKRALGDGFKTIKTKVGVDPAVDFERLKAIRETVGPDVKIRIDANQGWKPNEAVKLLNRMDAEGLNIELVEQPVKARDLDGLAFVTAHSPIPVVADESCWSAADALAILSGHMADMVNIKLMKCAGFRQARRIISIAQSLDTEVMMGCMLEGKISVAAAVALTSAFCCVTRIDLDGPVLCAEDPVHGGPVFTGGPEIRMSAAPGFGIVDVPGVKWIRQ